MKRGDLERERRAAGCELKRYGSNHDIWTNPTHGRSAPIPRYTEIANSLVSRIRKQLGLSS